MSFGIGDSKNISHSKFILPPSSTSSSLPSSSSSPPSTFSSSDLSKSVSSSSSSSSSFIYTMGYINSINAENTDKKNINKKHQFIFYLSSFTVYNEILTDFEVLLLYLLGSNYNKYFNIKNFSNPIKNFHLLDLNLLELLKKKYSILTNLNKTDFKNLKKKILINYLAKSNNILINFKNNKKLIQVDNLKIKENVSKKYLKRKLNNIKICYSNTLINSIESLGGINLFLFYFHTCCFRKYKFQEKTYEFIEKISNNLIYNDNDNKYVFPIISKILKNVTVTLNILLISFKFCGIDIIYNNENKYDSHNAKNENQSITIGDEIIINNDNDKSIEKESKGNIEIETPKHINYNGFLYNLKAFQYLILNWEIWGDSNLQIQINLVEILIKLISNENKDYLLNINQMKKANIVNFFLDLIFRSSNLNSILFEKILNFLKLIVINKSDFLLIYKYILYTTNLQVTTLKKLIKQNHKIDNFNKKAINKLISKKFKSLNVSKKVQQNNNSDIQIEKRVKKYHIDNDNNINKTLNESRSGNKDDDNKNNDNDNDNSNDNDNVNDNSNNNENDKKIENYLKINFFKVKNFKKNNWKINRKNNIFNHNTIFDSDSDSSTSSDSSSSSYSPSFSDSSNSINVQSINNSKNKNNNHENNNNGFDDNNNNDDDDDDDDENQKKNNINNDNIEIRIKIFDFFNKFLIKNQKNFFFQELVLNFPLENIFILIVNPNLELRKISIEFLEICLENKEFFEQFKKKNYFKFLGNLIKLFEPSTEIFNLFFKIFFTYNEVDQLFESILNVKNFTKRHSILNILKGLFLEGNDQIFQINNLKSLINYLPTFLDLTTNVKEEIQEEIIDFILLVSLKISFLENGINYYLEKLLINLNCLIKINEYKIQLIEKKILTDIIKKYHAILLENEFRIQLINYKFIENYLDLCKLIINYLNFWYVRNQDYKKGTRRSITKTRIPNLVDQIFLKLFCNLFFLFEKKILNLNPEIEINKKLFLKNYQQKKKSKKNLKQIFKKYRSIFFELFSQFFFDYLNLNSNFKMNFLFLNNLITNDQNNNNSQSILNTILLNSQLNQLLLHLLLKNLINKSNFKKFNELKGKYNTTNTTSKHGDSKIKIIIGMDKNKTNIEKNNINININKEKGWGELEGGDGIQGSNQKLELKSQELLTIIFKKKKKYNSIIKKKYNLKSKENLQNKQKIYEIINETIKIFNQWKDKQVNDKTIILNNLIFIISKKVMKRNLMNYFIEKQIIAIFNNFKKNNTNDLFSLINQKNIFKIKNCFNIYNNWNDIFNKLIDNEQSIWYTKPKLILYYIDKIENSNHIRNRLKKKRIYKSKIIKKNLLKFNNSHNKNLNLNPDVIQLINLKNNKFKKISKENFLYLKKNKKKKSKLEKKKINSNKSYKNLNIINNNNQFYLNLYKFLNDSNEIFNCRKLHYYKNINGELILNKKYLYFFKLKSSDNDEKKKNNNINDNNDKNKNNNNNNNDDNDDNGNEQVRNQNKIKYQRWKYSNIVDIKKYQYLLENNSLEIFFNNGKTIILIFESKNGKELCLNLLKKKYLPNINLNNQIKENKKLLNELTKKWEMGNITNFEYLMQLNKLSGRSYNDLTKYPVFPWILKNYEKAKLNLNDPNIYRDLSMPIGCQTKTKQDINKARYNELSKTGIEPSHYNTHYSNYVIIIYFLVRIEPFTSLMIDFQSNKFDLPDRLFQSIEISYKLSSLISRSDVKELIPEFFSLPEFLINMNGLDLGLKQNGQYVTDVQLPQWANNDVFDFIKLHRQALESDYISENLHNWIDLIFGYKQRGDDAIKGLNVYPEYTYLNHKEFGVIEDLDLKSEITDIIGTIGLCPKRLFKNPHPKKKFFSQMKKLKKKNSISKSQLTVTEGAFNKKKQKNKLDNKKSENDESDGIQLIDLKKNEKGLQNDIKNEKKIESKKENESDGDENENIKNYSGKQIYLKPRKLSSILFKKINSKFTKIIYEGKKKQLYYLKPCHSYLENYENNFLTIKWKPHLPYLLIYNQELKQNRIKCNIPLNDKILCCKNSSYGDLIVTGGETSILIVWKVYINKLYKNQIMNLKVHQILYGHKDSITSLDVSNDHQIIVSGSKDNTVIIWNLYNFKIRKVLNDLEGIIKNIIISKINGNIFVYCQNTLNGRNYCYLWNINGFLIKKLEMGFEQVTSAFFTWQKNPLFENILCIGLKSGRILILNALNLAFICKLDSNKSLPIISLACSQDMFEFFSLDSQGNTLKWKYDKKSNYTFERFYLNLFYFRMTKRRNHSNHNQNRKHHRNGIKKPKRQKNRSKKGMFLPYVKNMKFVRKGTLKAKMEKKKNQEKEMEVVKN
ncbi:beige/beach-related [Anaeramoeba flamelloides]|uniref:Beige/beach-related n=1 Tax=Anaeramoeba flamelloides TaxID=1746091 RepID=A0ABQ8XML4_9EUKA|nr:beige/beach-related [Anaeramoeba flamelloides]